jgi:hypothetical protein
MTTATLDYIRRRGDRLLTRAAEQLGYTVHVEIVLDVDGSYPKARDFAKTTGDVIYFSPKILRAPPARIEGLLRHELAHVVFMQAGNLDHTEREADALAEELFGDNIYYDAEDVQTILPGRRPRPHYLPN